MALENVMRVDNGNIVTGGGAGGSSVEIDWEDWCELTPEEQETGDWTIINCPWADGNVSVDLLTKLWENPSPTASFAAQDITLESDDYDLLLILSNYSTTNIRFAPASIGTSGYLNFADNSSSSAIAMYRAYTASNNKVTFTDNYRNGSVANGYLVPIVIYGIKLNATVKINAIAMDVKASVEYSTSEHLIGKWVDGSDLYERTYDFGAGANNTRKGLSSGLSNVTIRDLKAWGNSNLYGFGSVYIDSSDKDAFYYDYSNNYITQYANHNLSTVSYYVTLRYTKNS